MDEGWAGGRFPSCLFPGPFWGAALREPVPQGGGGSDRQGASYRRRGGERGPVRGQRTEHTGSAWLQVKDTSLIPTLKPLC